MCFFNHIFFFFLTLINGYQLWAITSQDGPYVDKLVQDHYFFFASKGPHFFLFTEEAFQKIEVTTTDELKNYALNPQFKKSYKGKSDIILKQLEQLNKKGLFLYAKKDQHLIELQWGVPLTSTPTEKAPPPPAKMAFEDPQLIQDLIDDEMLFYVASSETPPEYFILTQSSFQKVPIHSLKELKNYSPEKNFIKNNLPILKLLLLQLQIAKNKNYSLYAKNNQKLLSLDYKFPKVIMFEEEKREQEKKRERKLILKRLGVSLVNIQQPGGYFITPHFGWSPLYTLFPNQKISLSLFLGTHLALIDGKNQLVFEISPGGRFDFSQNYSISLSTGLQRWKGKNFVLMRPQIGYNLDHSFLWLKEVAFYYTRLSAEIPTYEMAILTVLQF